MTNKKIAIVGLGYVGLPLAVEFGKKRKVIGFDISKDRINLLKKNEDPNLEISKKEFSDSIHLSFSNNVDDIKDCNIFIITVPTPIYNNKLPDLTALKKSSQTVGSILKKNDIVILLRGGHGFKVKKNCKMIEVKQGPYSENEDKSKF